MGVIWSDLHKYECWLEVELAAAKALADLGEVPQEAAQALPTHAAFDLNRIQEIERKCGTMSSSKRSIGQKRRASG